MKSDCDCDNLDAYLADELSPEAAQQFAAHLASCGDCRESVQEQQWIDGLLRSPKLASVEAPTADFTNSIKSTLAQSRQRAGLVACVFATAAALLIAAGWAVSAMRNAHVAAVAPPERSDQVASVVVPDSDLVTAPIAIVTGDSSTFVVPVESPSPNVTIVRIYPTEQSLYAVNASDRRQSTGDGFAWPDNTNGGQ